MAMEANKTRFQLNYNRPSPTRPQAEHNNRAIEEMNWRLGGRQVFPPVAAAFILSLSRIFIS